MKDQEGYLLVFFGNEDYNFLLNMQHESGFPHICLASKACEAEYGSPHTCLYVCKHRVNMGKCMKAFSWYLRRTALKILLPPQSTEAFGWWHG